VLLLWLLLCLEEPDLQLLLRRLSSTTQTVGQPSQHHEMVIGPKWKTSRTKHKAGVAGESKWQPGTLHSTACRAHARSRASSVHCACPRTTGARPLPSAS
jgi:hypothetical protein